jgi:hypothetical protein
MKRLAAALVLAVVTSCSADSFEPSSRVDTLRVLAVRADLPFAQPGEAVHLSALTADPRGHARPIAYAWGTCLNPGSTEVGACGDAVPGFSLGGPTFDLTVPATALDGLTTPLGSLGVVFAACAGTFRFTRTATAPLACVGGDGTVLGRDDFMWGEKRVTITTALRNANPKIASLSLGGAAWGEADDVTLPTCGAAEVADCPSDQKRTLTIVAAPGSAQPYAGLTEDLVAYFFVSQGKVDSDYVRADGGAFTVTFAAVGADPSEPVGVWVVLRDDRGGVDWIVRTARLH